jgi:hypothetical protein
MRTLPGSIALSLLLGAPLLAPPAPLLADDVYLKNGRSFEGVVAEVGDSQVRVHMPGGVISLPRSAVDHVQKADSSFAEYLRQKGALESRENGPQGARRAEDWVELARWARRHNLQQGTREAALTAAQIDPRQPGLPALLRGFGFVYEESLDRWIPYDDSMRLHGFVREGGSWVSREEHAQRVRERDDERLARQAAFAAQQAAAAAREVADAEMLRAQADLAQQGAYGNGYGDGYTLGGYYGSLWPFTSGWWPSSSVFSVPGFGRFGFDPRRGFGRPGSGRSQRSERSERFERHGAFGERHERHETRAGRSLRQGGQVGFARPPARVIHP